VSDKIELLIDPAQMIRVLFGPAARPIQIRLEGETRVVLAGIMPDGSVNLTNFTRPEPLPGVKVWTVQPAKGVSQ
jgi:hypothetical protein